MKRRSLDFILTATGTLLAVTLLVAGGLLLFGANFTNNSVHNQLSQQKIFFPPKAAFDHAAPNTPITPSMIPSVSQYAGQQLLTGAQAKVYADDFIAVHLEEIGGGLTYSELSAKAMADPTNTVLADQVQTMFQGTTLRAMLLNAYAFSMLGTIALISALSCFVLAGIMILMSALGILHYRRTEDSLEFPKSSQE